MRRLPRFSTLGLAAVLAATLLACGEDGPPAPKVSPPTLPEGRLRQLVLQPLDLPIALAPLSEQTGPATIDDLAAFSADKDAAAAQLREHGMTEGYTVEYYDPDTRRIVINVVAEFATEQGASLDFRADAAASVALGAPLGVPDLGDEAAAVSAKLDPEAEDGTLLTMRWRVGKRTWLLALGNTSPITTAEARRYAELLIGRAAEVE